MLGTYVVVLITTPSKEEAERIARDLLSKKLAACVNIVSDVKSLFWWKEKIDEANECLLVIKTRLDQMEELIESVKRIHSYTVPEIIVLPIITGNTRYLEWINQTIKKPE
ncbi:MAG: divalent-cation tolerance protein CutA [Thaumarchaeota archaeon]|nr:MAG: divalent-cation tolerance protein CutA [Nitrososphaerota archaeon]